MSDVVVLERLVSDLVFNIDTSENLIGERQFGGKDE